MNVFTAKHEAKNLLVQSQGRGLWMVLDTDPEAFEDKIRLATDLPSYSAACDVADRIAATR